MVTFFMSFVGFFVLLAISLFGGKSALVYIFIEIKLVGSL